MEVERALAAERRQLADAQQLASVGSWELDLETGERTWSEQQFRNHGFDPEAPLPTFEEVLERIHPDDQVEVLRRVAEIEAGNLEFDYSYRIVLPDGRTREIVAEGRPFVEEDGSTRLMGTSRDVTAERDAERVKDDFFGLVSHELRTPLTSIIGYAELLAEVEADNLSEQGRRFVEVIERNSRRELSLVGDLLLLTRITAGTFEIEIGRADLGELVRASAEEAAPDLTKADVELRLDLDDAPVIDADPHRLGQVIDNLLSNAIKFTPRGGHVDIRVARDGDHASLVFSDTGIGIPPEDTDRLFERMFRAREAERRHIQGTGLGLTIAKAIVDAHRGSISVESDIGRGTTFTIELPLVADVEPAEARS
jgi:signal transduction histidine kinase